MRTGEQLRLQANLRDQLWLHLQITPIADTVLQLCDHPPTMLCSHFLILLIELHIQTRDRVLPSLLLSRYITLQECLFLLDLLLLLYQLLQCCLHTLLLDSGGLTLLIGRFHERQELVFECFKALLTDGNFRQDSAVLLIGFDFVRLALGLSEGILIAPELALKRTLLPFTLLNCGLLLRQLLPCCRARGLVSLQALRELLLLCRQSAQAVIHMLELEQKPKLVTHRLRSYVFLCVNPRLISAVGRILL